MGLRKDVDFLKKRLTFFPCLESNPGSSSPQLSYYAETRSRNNSACNVGKKTELATFLSRVRNLQTISECSGITLHFKRHTQHTGDVRLRYRKSSCHVSKGTDIVKIRQ